MNIAIRTDASALIGTGHLIRCLTLAEHLRASGANVQFVSREHQGSLCDLLEEREFPVVRLPEPLVVTPPSKPDDYRAWLAVPWEQDAQETSSALDRNGHTWQWLVLDHYGLDYRWEEAVRPEGCRLMIIDDLANRRHSCDLLLDQNFYLDYETRYDALTPAGCRRLLGPSYAILRPQFYERVDQVTQRTGKVERILIFYGGVDATGETLKTLRALESVCKRGDIALDVIVGASNPEVKDIEAWCRRYGTVDCHQRVENMAELMARVDFSFGGGGTTTWERCILGLPTATIEVAGNQRIALEALALRGAVWHLGLHSAVTEAMIAERLYYALDHPDDVRELGTNARAIMGDAEAGAGCPAVAAMLENS